MDHDDGGEGRSENGESGEAADAGSGEEGEGHEEEMGGTEDLEITNQGSTSTIFSSKHSAFDTLYQIMKNSFWQRLSHVCIWD